MTDLRTLLEHEVDRVAVEPMTLDGLHGRRVRKQRRQRVTAVIAALLVVVSTFGLILRAIRSVEPRPAQPTPSGPVEMSFPLTTRPQTIDATVADGSIWAALLGGPLVRFDGDTGAEVARIDLGVSGLVDGILATEGTVWVDVYTFRKGGWLIEVDPRTNDVITTIDLDHDATFIAQGPGSVWACQIGDGDARLLRIDLATHELAPLAGIAIASCGSMLSADGSLWMLEKDGAVVQVDPATGSLTSTPMRIAGGWTGALAFGDGRIWGPAPCVPPCPGGYAVLGYDPATGQTERIPIGLSPGVERRNGRSFRVDQELTVVAADDDAVWLTTASYFDDQVARAGAVGPADWRGLLIRLDPSSGEVRTAPIRGFARTGVLDGEILWLFDEMHGRMLRVDTARLFP